MKKIIVVLAFMMASLGLSVGVANATAPECKSVTVQNRTGLDSGENENNWAMVTIDRTLEICVDSMALINGTYIATVTDSGEFVTLAGDSPGEGTVVKLTGGIHGTIRGGFTAKFTAPANWGGMTNLVKPAPSITTGKWVETAFPGAVFDGKGSVAGWRWVYNLCGEHGEWWVNAEAGNSGDITERSCPTAPVTTPPVTTPPATTPPATTPPATEGPSPSPSATLTAGPGTPTPTDSPDPSETALVPVDNSSNGGLPTTGGTFPWTLIATGLVLVFGGGALLTVAYRRHLAPA